MKQRYEHMKTTITNHGKEGPWDAPAREGWQLVSVDRCVGYAGGSGCSISNEYTQHTDYYWKRPVETVSREELAEAVRKAGDALADGDGQTALDVIDGLLAKLDKEEP